MAAAQVREPQRGETSILGRLRERPMENPRVERAPVHAADDEAFIVVLRTPLGACRLLSPMVMVESIEHAVRVDDTLARGSDRKRQRGVGNTRDRVCDGDQTGGRIDVRPPKRENLAYAQPESQQVPGDLKS